MGLAGVGGEWEVSWVVGAKVGARPKAAHFFFAGGGLCVLRVLQQNRVVVWGVRSGLVWEGGACGAAEGRLP